jgi:hypothetical protein
MVRIGVTLPWGDGRSRRGNAGAGGIDGRGNSILNSDHLSPVPFCDNSLLLLFRVPNQPSVTAAFVKLSKSQFGSNNLNSILD